MKNLKKGIWFPISLVVLVAVIALWAPFTYGGIFLYNRHLLDAGVVESAKIIRKGVLVRDKLVWTRQSQNSGDHQLQVEFFNSGGERNICQFSVSKLLYDYHPPGTKIPVIFLPEDPQKCKMSAGIPGTQLILKFALGISAFMMLFASGSLFFVFKSYKKSGPGDSSSLATEIGLKEGMCCPKCDSEMIEGYLPMGSGIIWRNINQPVGIPTVFGGLPGTVFLGKRPKLHAYHCASCKIVTFKYGKK